MGRRQRTNKHIQTRNRFQHCFSTAALVFSDDSRIEKYDDAHSDDEDRYITIGQIQGQMIVVMVVYTEREEAIRIISARRATKREEEAYYNAEDY